VADAVKISELPNVTVGSFGVQDHFIVNDVSNDTVGVTRKISVGSFVNWISTQDLSFDNIELNSITPGPGGLNITVDGIFIKDELTLDVGVDVTGIDIADLDDISIDEGLLNHGHVLMWDSQGGGSWVHDYVDLSNAGDSTSIKLDLLEDTINTLNDSIMRLLDSIEALQNDVAPSDGGYYAKQNGQWVDITDILMPSTNYIIYDGGTSPT